MIGQIISHYHILEKIGSGGMGEVYKAEDTKLRRTVALKFLPPELSRDPDAKARFIHEARAASALDHPNICTVHDIGEDAEGRMFMVMPYYEGSTLKEILARGGITESIPAGGASVGARPHPGTGRAVPLPIHDAVAIAAQIAEGLAAAHAKGIVHRESSRPTSSSPAARRSRSSTWHRQAGGKQDQADQDRQHGGDGGLHVARAGPGQGS